jgi:Fe-S cluster assembly ATP-binding protein
MRSPDRTFVIITHYSRILSLIKPDEIHILVKGKIVKEGGPELADKLEEQGYGWLNEETDNDENTVKQ